MKTKKAQRTKKFIIYYLVSEAYHIYNIKTYYFQLWATFEILSQYNLK